MASNAVTFLLTNLTQPLIQESKLLGGVKHQVRLLYNELRMISVFLQNIEEKRHDNGLVKEVGSQIKDVAYEAEDVIDTFIMTLTKQRRRSMLSKVIHSCEQAIVFHGVANKIKSIKNVIQEIYDNRSKYGVEIDESSGGDALMKQLIEGSLQRNVVSIIGMGGLGKTTLARKIYNNNDVKNYFDFRGWVYVSQEYRIRELLFGILKGVIPMPKVKKFILKAELKGELFHGLKVKYSSNKDKLKGALTGLEGIKEMNDEDCKNTLYEILVQIEDQNLQRSLSELMKDIYEKNGEGWVDLNDDELKSVLFECLKDEVLNCHR